MKRMLAILVAGAMWAGAAGAGADQVTLKNGATFEGTVTETGDRVQIRIDSGTMTFHRDKVASIERKTSPLAEYESRRTELAADDIQGHFALGLWARHAGLASSARTEFEAVLELDRDHAGAREALGYRCVEGEWLTDDEWRAKRGETREDGKWVTREQREEKGASEEVAALREEVRLLREQMSALVAESQRAVAALVTENRRLKDENLNLAASTSQFAALVISLQDQLAWRDRCASVGQSATCPLRCNSTSPSVITQGPGGITYPAAPQAPSLLTPMGTPLPIR